MSSKENKKPKADRKNKKDRKPKTDEASSEPSSSRTRTLWIALAVLAVLAAVLWYLNRQGYLRRWFPVRSSRPQQYYDASPSAPPYPTEGF